MLCSEHTMHAAELNFIIKTTEQDKHHCFPVPCWYHVGNGSFKYSQPTQLSVVSIPFYQCNMFCLVGPHVLNKHTVMDRGTFILSLNKHKRSTEIRRNCLSGKLFKLTLFTGMLLSRALETLKVPGNMVPNHWRLLTDYKRGILCILLPLIWQWVNKCPIIITSRDAGLLHDYWMSCLKGKNPFWLTAPPMQQPSVLACPLLYSLPEKPELPWMWWFRCIYPIIVIVEKAELPL